jgi:exopolysaccharide biosynthesis protein
MKRLSLICTLLLAAAAVLAQDEWQPVGPGVTYEHIRDGSMDIHVARIDLTSDKVRIVASRQSDFGTRVSEFAKRTHALIAINGDYFDKVMKPIGLVIGPCGQWSDTKDTSREGVVAFGPNRAEVRTQSEVMDPPEDWVAGAVSGWPMLVRECHALTSTELPGSDGFTRSPHARTAVGITKDGSTLYLVVADGRRKDVPGLTLGQLGAWMADKLQVCSAINLDGGGSSTMWVTDHVVNQPSDGAERRVGDHLAVVAADEEIACDPKKERDAAAALRVAEAKAATAVAPVDLDNAKATVTLKTDAPPPPPPAATSTSTSTQPPR